MNSHINDVVDYLIAGGIKPRLVENIKNHYRVKKQETPYMRSEVIGTAVGEFYGGVVFFRKGGALVIEYDAEKKRYNAEFRLVTGDRGSLPDNDIYDALPTLSGKPQFIFRPKIIGAENATDLVNRLMSIDVFVKKGRDD